LIATLGGADDAIGLGAPSLDPGVRWTRVPRSDTLFESLGLGCLGGVDSKENDTSPSRLEAETVYICLALKSGREDLNLRSPDPEVLISVRIETR
jgi:hypothetical protein